MSAEAREGSVTKWLAAFKEGDERATQEIWERYRRLLVSLADRWLGSDARKTADEDDIAQSAFIQCWKQVKAEKYPQLQNRDDLEKILRDLVRKRVSDQRREQRAQKRGSGDVRGESAVLSPYDPSGAPGMGGVAETNVLSPDEQAEFHSTFGRLFASLTDAEREIAFARLEDFTVTDKELATRFDCSVSLIRLRLKTIRKKWNDLQH